MDCEENPEVECVRGLGAWRFWDNYWVIASICNIIVIIFAGLLVYSVFRREQVTDKYLTKGMEKKRVHTMKTAWHTTIHSDILTLLTIGEKGGSPPHKIISPQSAPQIGPEHF